MENTDDARHPTKDHNVFEDLGFTEEEALNLKIRADLATLVRTVVISKKLKQADAAEYLGVTRPQVSELLHGKISRFSLDKLVKICQRIGYNVSVEVNPQPGHPEIKELQKMIA